MSDILDKMKLTAYPHNVYVAKGVTVHDVIEEMGKLQQQRDEYKLLFETVSDAQAGALEDYKALKQQVVSPADTIREACATIDKRTRAATRSIDAYNKAMVTREVIKVFLEYANELEEAINE